MEARAVAHEQGWSVEVTSRICATTPVAPARTGSGLSWTPSAITRNDGEEPGAKGSRRRARDPSRPSWASSEVAHGGGGRVKELTQIDGAFVVDDGGSFVAAGRLIATDFSAAEVPLGLGARHAAAASISSTTNAIAVALSQSSIVRVFSHGELRAEISPKLFVGTAQSSFSLEWPGFMNWPALASPLR